MLVETENAIASAMEERNKLKVWSVGRSGGRLGWRCQGNTTTLWHSIVAQAVVVFPPTLFDLVGGLYIYGYS